MRQRRVDAVDEVNRPRLRAHLLAEGPRERGERPVEADREAVVARAGSPDVVDLLARQTERLLDEHRLARAQRRRGDLRVGVVARADHHQVDLRVLDRDAPVGCGPGAAELTRDARRGRPAPGDDEVDTRVRVALEVRQVHAAHEPADADHRDTDRVAGLAVAAARDADHLPGRAAPDGSRT